MKTSLKKISLIALIYAQTLEAQNLIPNQGFENFTACPVGFSQFNGYVSNWTDPSTASPDYYNACANPNPAGVPVNGFGYQFAHTGNAYAGMYCTAGTYREYIQAHLSSPLTAGTAYTFSMYVVVHNRSKDATDDLGAYISVTAPTSAGTGFLNGNPVPQITNTAGNVITDSLNWTLISGTYIASGGEQYVTLGHFKTDANSTYQNINYGSQGSYYYIDDVSLTPSVSLPVELIEFTAQLDKSDEHHPVAHLTWITASERNNCCFEIERSSAATYFFHIGTVKGSGNSSATHEYYFTDQFPLSGISYYRLKQMDDDGRYNYSETAKIENAEAHLNLIVKSIGESFSKSLVISSANSALLIRVTDMTGRKVYFKKQDASDLIMINLSDISSGIYLLSVLNETGETVFSDKIFF